MPSSPWKSAFFPVLALLGSCASGGSEGDSDPEQIPCQTDLDCDRRSVCDPDLGYCVPGPDGGAPDAGEEEDEGLLCDVCEANHDCTEVGAVCLRLDAGRFCGRLCGDDQPDCPEGFSCAEVTDGDGDPAGNQCTPTNGDCACLPENDGDFRPCSVENDFGICEGIQTCFDETGWGPCQAPEPAPEVCDGQDNDCDGPRDEEEDLELGTCGQGVCVAAEECTPAPDGASLTCEPGPRVLENDTDCNGEDDDCDGKVDEEYEPIFCGQGVCLAESTCDDSLEVCIPGQATLQFDTTCNAVDENCDGTEDEDWVPTTCGVGICVAEGECLDGVEQCTPGDPEPDDLPEMTFEDSNCDGIDGDVEGGIFVDWLTGDDGNDGSMESPLQTVTAGIDAASIWDKDVYISEGTYNESLTLVDGVGLYGGYAAADGWSRSVGNLVEISGGSTAVRGTDIDSPTELQLLTIRSADAPLILFGTSSIGLLLTSSDGVTLTNVIVRAGDGAGGADGVDGVDGTDGGPGRDGNPGCQDDADDAWDLCFEGDSCDRPAGGAGGASTCSHAGGAGGRPGRSCGCGEDGVDAPSDGTNGGSGGCGCGGGDGGPGDPGAPGSAGTDGARGGSFGTTGAGGYTAVGGENGASGTSGAGAGGGGGGSGGDNDCESYGSSGGGGGAGGCRGTRGTGGGGGGGSFGVFLWQSTLAVVDSDVHTGSGGNAGSGGTGGDAGTGGDPGQGGPYGGSGEQDDGGDGAAGGRGGNGGRGGHGGGGGGGPTIGIECAGGSALGSDLGNSFVLGTAGSGGSSSGNSGLDGLRQNRHGC